MRTIIFLAILSINFQSFSQSVHDDPIHNFTVQRLIVLNDKGEMLLSLDQHVWVPLSFVYERSQYVKESLDSLANAYGVTIKDIELRGQFSYKYDYHPHSTMRNFYVAKYAGGNAKVPEGLDEVKWVKVEDAIDLINVIAIREISQQIIEDPNVIWGGSFLVSRVGKDHPTRMVGTFYPLFRR